MSLLSDLSTLETKEETLLSNQVSMFAYDSTAYNSDDADGVESFDSSDHNTIPLKTPSVIATALFVIEKGLRDQASSLPRMLINHIFGRASYNLNKTVDVLSDLLSVLNDFVGNSNGLATLDNNGRIPASQLSEDAVEYKGAWNAETNTPNLNTVAKDTGDMYLVSVKGTQDIGEGSIQYNVGDEVIYNGTIWQRIPTGDVDSVNNISPDTDDNVTVNGNDISYDSGKVDIDDIPKAISYIENKLRYTFIGGQNNGN